MGIDLYELKNNENKMDTYDLGQISYDIKIDEDRKTYYFLFARLGFEWRIQDRFGLALFSQVYMWQDSVPVEATLIRNPATSPGTGRIIVYEFKTPLFMLGLTGSFYF